MDYTEPDFDEEYADELAILEEIEDYEKSSGHLPKLLNKSKPRRVLNFGTEDETSVNNEEIDDSNSSVISSQHTVNSEESLLEVDSLSPFNGALKRKLFSSMRSDKSSLTQLDSEDIDKLEMPSPPEKRHRPQFVRSDVTGYGKVPQQPTVAKPPPQSTSGRILTRIPESDFVSVTGMSGVRHYIPVCDEYTIRQQIEEQSLVSQSVNLLSTPFYELKNQVLRQREETQLQEITRPSIQDVEMSEEMETTKTVINRNLWVEKYSPIKYTQLLSDEGVNRSLLQWIKLWDYVVFNKELPTKSKNKKKETEKEKKFKKNEIEINQELDDYRRPTQKVVLLCGPPGLGKTTLAHIIARHAGYNVIEINASDDRSAKLFKSSIESSTQMRAVLGEERRPNCLVIDEIDGAPVAAINELLSIIKYPEGASKRSKNKQILLRPIICICNDAYVPALRELKKIALVLTFPQTVAHRLAARLNEVVHCESMKADMNCLLALCEKADNDIRSCLNTLQFLRQQHSELTLRLVQKMSLGQKDSHKTLFSVWYDIFSLPKPKRARLGSTLTEQDRLELTRWQQNDSLSARFTNILDVVNAAGDHNKVNQGIYENYLLAKSKDPHLTGLNRCTEWLCFVDQLNDYIASKQDYSVMKYIPYMAVTFHLIYGSNSSPKIQYPHTQFEHMKALNKSSSLISGILSDMTPSARMYLDHSCVILDVLPWLLVILQPTLRPVNTQLYSAREKGDMKHLVDIMIEYNVTYKQQKQLDMQYTYSLEPNIEELVKFEGLNTHQQKSLTYAAKQLIAREIDVEKMRRSELAYGSTAGPSTQKTVNKPVIKSPPTKTARSLEITESKPVRNFFGQIVKKSEKSNKKDEKNANLVSDKLWFQFKEGFSNAVRRNVRVNDFL